MDDWIGWIDRFVSYLDIEEMDRLEIGWIDLDK
jgi:hypothetical protein